MSKLERTLNELEELGTAPELTASLRMKLLDMRGEMLRAMTRPGSDGRCEICNRELKQ